MVYEAKCSICGRTYIGSTTRPLHIRVREHLYVVKRRDDGSAIAEHYVNEHPTDSPSVTFRIIASATDELRLRIQEAYWIKKLCPGLNRKSEHLGTGFVI